MTDGWTVTDRLTDRQTLHDGIGHIYAQNHAAKNS